MTITTTVVDIHHVTETAIAAFQATQLPHLAADLDTMIEVLRIEQIGREKGTGIEIGTERIVNRPGHVHGLRRGHLLMLMALVMALQNRATDREDHHQRPLARGERISTRTFPHTVIGMALPGVMTMVQGATETAIATHCLEETGICCHAGIEISIDTGTYHHEDPIATATVTYAEHGVAVH